MAEEMRIRLWRGCYKLSDLKQHKSWYSHTIQKVRSLEWVNRAAFLLKV